MQSFGFWATTMRPYFREFPTSEGIWSGVINTCHCTGSKLKWDVRELELGLA
jgi:hypothetical protein